MSRFHWICRVAPAAMFALVVGVLSTGSQAGITGSKHDFGAFGWAKNEVCLPCHTPHNAIVKDANGNQVGGPLWNHTLSTATYTMYNWEQGKDVTVQLDQNSKLCMSCHDGTVAVDSFGGGAGTQQLTGGLLGTDMTKNHPIGDAAVWPTGASYMVDEALRDAAHIMPLRLLADGRKAVGCTSCHEPHNRKNTDAMLWVSNKNAGTTVDGRAVAGSTLCFNCHKK